MKEIVKLEAYNIEQLVNLSGVKDENLEVLEDHFDEGIKESAENKVKLRISRLNSLIGRDFSKDEAISYLKALEFDVKDIDDDTIEANIPNFRMDISIEADLIEEVARLYGLGKVESKPLYSSL